MTDRNTEERDSHPTPPPRDADRPQDDPWDAEVIRFLLATAEGRVWRRGELMECLRQQPHRQARQPERVRAAAELAQLHGVQVRPDPGGKTLHFFRHTDSIRYPRSSSERRQLLRGWRD